jgi:hypothetical protein
MPVYDKSMPVMTDAPLLSEDKSQLIGMASVNVKFSQDVIALEIANNSTNATIYLNIDGALAVLTKGVPIYAQTYYAANRKILASTGICLISDHNATDVRIIGHYELTSEIK